MLILVFQTNYTASFYLIILLPSPGFKKKIQRTVQKTLKGTKTLRCLLEALWKAFCLKLPTILFENIVFLKSFELTWSNQSNRVNWSNLQTSKIAKFYLADFSGILNSCCFFVSHNLICNLKVEG